MFLLKFTPTCWLSLHFHTLFPPFFSLFFLSSPPLSNLLLCCRTPLFLPYLCLTSLFLPSLPLSAVIPSSLCPIQLSFLSSPFPSYYGSWPRSFLCPRRLHRCPSMTANPDPYPSLIMSVLQWNIVSGFLAHRQDQHHLISSFAPKILCLQETFLICPPFLVC